jgi:hypothetical protein
MCGKTKSECDENFIHDMLSMCQSYRDQRWNPLSRILYSTCALVALSYYDFVWGLGQPYYDKAQHEYCPEILDDKCYP